LILAFPNIARKNFDHSIPGTYPPSESDSEDDDAHDVEKGKMTPEQMRVLIRRDLRKRMEGQKKRPVRRPRAETVQKVSNKLDEKKRRPYVGNRLRI